MNQDAFNRAASILVGIGIVVLFSLAFGWVVASRSLAQLEKTIELARNSTVSGPVMVSQTSCHFLHPGRLDSIFQPVICPSCLTAVRDFTASYDAKLLADHCHKSNVNPFVFTPK